MLICALFIVRSSYIYCNCSYLLIIYLQNEKVRLLDARGEVEGVLCGVEGEKAELLQDNQRMAQVLAGSEGDRKDVAALLERVVDERKDFQRQCKHFKEKGGCGSG